MDENLHNKEALVARIQQLERERDELRKDIEQLCMQNAGPSYLAVATRMHFQRTAGLEQEIENLKKQLAACIRENVNLQEELSEAYRVKTQLADLHSAEVLKSMEVEKQAKFFQGCVAAAFAERDHSVMEAEKAKEKEESVLQQLDGFQQRIEELTSDCLEEQKLSAALRIDLEKQEKENEIFKKVIHKFFEIRGHSPEESEDISWYDKCERLLHDSADLWSFTDYGESSTSAYITALEKEVDALRKSLDNFQNKLHMGMEIERHLKKKVYNLENEKIRLEEKMTKGISGLLQHYYQHRVDIKNLIDEGFSHLKSTIDVVHDTIKQLQINGELNIIHPRIDTKLQESECRDVHVTSDASSDLVTKDIPLISMLFLLTRARQLTSERLTYMLKSVALDQANASGLPTTFTIGSGDNFEVLAQALQEKVAALLLLSQQEERYLLESNVNAVLQKKLEEFQINLFQVTNEKVKALMELAQLKQKHQLLQEKVGLEMKQGKDLADSEVASIVQDRDGRLKNMLKKTYLGRWINPLDSNASEAEARLDYEEKVSNKRSNYNTDFARMRIENAALKESLESLWHLTSSVHRLRGSLEKVKESVVSDNACIRQSEDLENIVSEAKLLKTALGSSLPASWSNKGDVLSGKGVDEDIVLSGDSSSQKVDSVSAAGFQMAELLTLAAELLMYRTT